MWMSDLLFITYKNPNYFKRLLSLLFVIWLAVFSVLSSFYGANLLFHSEVCLETTLGEFHSWKQSVYFDGRLS